MITHCLPPHLFPETPENRAKFLVGVGAISVALVVIAAIGTSTGHIPVGVNGACFTFGLLGSCMFCQSLPFCCYELISSQEWTVTLPSTRRVIGRENLVTTLQEAFVTHRSNWDEAALSLLRNGTILAKEESDNCHDMFQLGETLLVEGQSDEVSTPGKLCKPVSLRRAIDRGEEVDRTEDFVLFVAQLKKRYAQDIENPFFLIIERHFNRVVEAHPYLDLIDDMDVICRLALFDLLRGADREGSILIFDGGYRIDFADQTPINPLTSFHTGLEEDIIEHQPLRLYEAIKERSDQVELRSAILSGSLRVFDQVSATHNPDPDHLERVANLIRDRYYAKYASHYSDEGPTEVITGNHELFMEKIRERFTLGDSWWAGTGNCFIGSALMVTQPGIEKTDHMSQLDTLLQWRKKVSTKLCDEEAHFRPFFSTKAAYKNHFEDIKNMSMDFDSPAMEALARVLDRPIHVYIPSAASFSTDKAGHLLPSNSYNQESTNPPINILGGHHCQPLFPIDSVSSNK